MLNYIIWDLDPDILTLGPLKIRYYGLLFACGFALGYNILKRIFKKEGISLEWLDSLLMYVLAGTVIGARLGHCLFYEPEYYLSHPIEIFKVWNGGLASHGGAFGILIAMAIYSKKVTHKSPVWTLDRLLIVVALAGCMIRLGNLANSEIYGHQTDSSIGFVHVHDSYFGRFIQNEKIAKFVDDYTIEKEDKINDKEEATLLFTYNKYIKNEEDAKNISEYNIRPLLNYREANDGSAPNLYMLKEAKINITQEDGLYKASFPIIVVPKHPTHIYEATCYLLSFFLLMFIYERGGLKRHGLIFGVFLICIFGSRFFIEMIKENQVNAEVGKLLNNGQKLSIPFIIAGIYYIIRASLPSKKKSIVLASFPSKKS